MCEKVFSKEPLGVKYCPNRYKTKKMCHKTVNFYWLV